MTLKQSPSHRLFLAFFSLRQLSFKPFLFKLEDKDEEQKVRGPREEEQMLSAIA